MPNSEKRLVSARHAELDELFSNRDAEASKALRLIFKKIMTIRQGTHIHTSSLIKTVNPR